MNSKAHPSLGHGWAAQLTMIFLDNPLQYQRHSTKKRSCLLNLLYHGNINIVLVYLKNFAVAVNFAKM